jgi:solute carrier family 6 GABA transporter-like protein 1
LKRDLNLIVGGNGNWNIPTFWPILLRYVSAPILAIVFSFAYPEFYTLRYDPMMIAGFILGHFFLLLILLGVVFPRYYNILSPPHRRAEGTELTIANEPKEQNYVREARTVDHELGMTESASRKSSEGIDAEHSTTTPKL